MFESKKKAKEEAKVQRNILYHLKVDGNYAIDIFPLLYGFFIANTVSQCVCVGCVSIICV